MRENAVQGLLRALTHRLPPFLANPLGSAVQARRRTAKAHYYTTYAHCSPHTEQCLPNSPSGPTAISIGATAKRNLPDFPRLMANGSGAASLHYDGPLLYAYGTMLAVQAQQP